MSNRFSFWCHLNVIYGAPLVTWMGKILLRGYALLMRGYDLTTRSHNLSTRGQELIRCGNERLRRCHIIIPWAMSAYCNPCILSCQVKCLS